MRKACLVVIGIAALILVPVLEASAQSRKNTQSNAGYCKSGAKVSDMKDCKENGGAK